MPRSLAPDEDIMTTTGDVQITVADGTAGIVVVPSQSVQVVIGCATAGTVGQVVATRSLSTLTSSFTSGPLPEASGLAIQAGGTVLAIRATTATAGFINGTTQIIPAITATNTSSPIQVTSTAHGLITGDVVTISGVVGQTGANGTFQVTVLTANTFTLNNSTSVGAWVSGGTIAFTGGVVTATGTSAMWFTGAALDYYHPQVTIVAGGTVAVAGITFKISLDAGRTYGPTIALGTALTYAITGTGLTVNFQTGKTLVAGDYVRSSTTGPEPDAAGVAVALAALQASPYAATGWGSIHIVGTFAASDAAAFQASGATSLDSLATGDIYTGAIFSCRDAKPPTAWGGLGETEAAWMAAIELDFISSSCKRLSCSAGHYNMPSAFPTAIASVPRFRRPLSWAYAARQVTIPAQRHAGRVKDGALAQIVVDATSDPSDGFLYHDERINPGLDFKTGGAGRFTSARTRVGLGSSGLGYYIVNPLTLAPLGSDFWMFPYRLVMDVACDIAHGAGQQVVNDDLRANANGTLSDRDALAIKNAVLAALNTGMTNVGMISGCEVAVDQTQNILVTSTVVITIRILARGYALQETVTIGFANQLAA
jgi:hypothetical protein